MKNYLSPNGSPILGTLEHLTARAEISGINDDGTPEYAGDTEIFWDGQTTADKDGKIIFLDENGDEWTFDQLTVDEEEEGFDADAYRTELQERVEASNKLCEDGKA